MGQFISADNILDSDGRYKARAKAADQSIRDAATILAGRLDELFSLYKQSDRPRITSGYRTPAANKAAGGAPRSSHLEGRAADFADADGVFAAWCLAHLNVLEDNNLWMESPDHTKGWVHLQSREVPGKRVFIP